LWWCWGLFGYGWYGRYVDLGTALLYGTAMAKLTVKVSEEELAAWKVAAHIRRTTLSGWVRQVLSATAAAMKEGNGG
jgi:hypothetical protein